MLVRLLKFSCLVAFLVLNLLANGMCVGLGMVAMHFYRQGGADKSQDFFRKVTAMHHFTSEHCFPIVVFASQLLRFAYALNYFLSLKRHRYGQTVDAAISARQFVIQASNFRYARPSSQPLYWGLNP